MAAPLPCWRTAATFGISHIKAFLPTISECGHVQQIAHYNPRPLPRKLKTLYIPDKESEKTPVWQKTPKYDRKLFGRYGAASGVDPAKLWPTHEQLEKMIAEESEWHPPLEKMLQNITAKEKEKEKKRLAREEVIAANMAKMPKMIADWQRDKREAKQKRREEKARRDALLVEARERFGHAVDPRSIKFQEMVSEIEKEEKKKKKVQKRRLKLEEQGQIQPVPVASS